MIVSSNYNSPVHTCMYQGHFCVRKRVRKEEAIYTERMSPCPQSVDYIAYDGYLYMEHIEGVFLYTALKYPEAYDRERLITDLVYVLKYMEKENISHNDLHEENIIVKEGIKVIDWGSARDQFNDPWYGTTDATDITRYISRLIGIDHDLLIDCLPGVYWKQYTGWQSEMVVIAGEMKENIWIAICRDLLRTYG